MDKNTEISKDEIIIKTRKLSVWEQEISHQLAIFVLSIDRQIPTSSIYKIDPICDIDHSEPNILHVRYYIKEDINGHDTLIITEKELELYNNDIISFDKFLEFSNTSEYKKFYNNVNYFGLFEYVCKKLEIELTEDLQLYLQLTK